MRTQQKMAIAAILGGVLTPLLLSVVVHALYLTFSPEATRDGQYSMALLPTLLFGPILGVTGATGLIAREMGDHRRAARLFLWGGGSVTILVFLLLLISTGGAIPRFVDLLASFPVGVLIVSSAILVFPGLRSLGRLQ